MVEKKKLKEVKLSIDEEKFAAAMEKLASDEKMQKDLDEKPLEVLEELGIKFDEDTRENLKDKNFMEIMGVTEKDLEMADIKPIAATNAIIVQPKPKTTVITPKALSYSRVQNITGSTIVRVKVQNGPAMMVRTNGPAVIIQTGEVIKKKPEKKK